METSVYFWHVCRTAQKKYLKVGSTNTGGSLCSACLKSEVCRRWKARQVLPTGLHESSSVAGIGAAHTFVRWLCKLKNGDASPLLMTSADWRDLGWLYSKKGIKSSFVTVGPRADRPCRSRCQTFPLLWSLLKLWKAKNGFYCSHPKRWHLASVCSWMLALECVCGYCLRNYCYTQVTSLKGHWAELEQHSRW